ncbi:protein capicua homolog [Hyalella azteca]|uniref:Protein capicua homolog n=1 Tax=Hyalella azteca TaxID=294128 RepID=A0A8B7N0W6_HYAAZ|nr:protein capicua homolog [Hyalella azteca]
MARYRKGRGAHRVHPITDRGRGSRGRRGRSSAASDCTDKSKVRPSKSDENVATDVCHVTKNSFDDAKFNVFTGKAKTATPEGKDNITSQHPARRPMNAYLLFCRKYRKEAQKEHPKLENRQLSKVLSKWWAILNPLEKKGYQDQASQLKESFLRANPDFKWYQNHSLPPEARPSHLKVLRHQHDATSTPTNSCVKRADSRNKRTKR